MNNAVEIPTQSPSTDVPSHEKFGTPDIVVVVVYFVFVLAVGIWASHRASRATIGGYFLAGRSMTWLPIGASLMSSNVGSGLFIGMAGSGAAGGLAVGGFEWNASWVLIALGWIFVPVYIAAGVVTLPEYLEKRFGGQRIRIYMSVMSLILYIFIKISTDIYSGALFIQISLGWDIYLATVILLLVTGIYTIAGGLTAVIYTDTLQTAIMLVGAFTLMFINEVACVDPVICERVCGIKVGCTNIAYPKLVIELMPVGLKGLMIAVIMAALMSSLTSIFNSSSSLFTLDIWLKMRKNATEVELMVVGRIFVAVLVAISILWIPIIQAANSGQLFDYMQSVTSYLSPPVTALFILAIFCKRINESGAFWGLIVGLVVGFIRMVMDFVYRAPYCGEEDTRPSVLKDVHYLYFALILFGLTALVCIVVSLCTPSIPDENLVRLTWWSRHSTAERADLVDPWDQSKEEESPRQEPGSDLQTIPEFPWWKNLYYWFCGISRTPAPKLTKEEREILEIKLTSIEEKPKWRRICNINAIILLAINIFLWGYFG
uniref:Sodium/glucose cotransporter 4 isoform X2 n=1 Tax=Geotrypetes seraphini TaxID=260995 RepID=A0A6P8NVW7_GEOSA|nr:sodium/glucose cotransporter 4 isoform X2 [Geotrypetes seraphini]